MTRSSEYVLGLDLGTSSLGWAVLDLAGNRPVRIRAAGVRIFEAGVEGDVEQGKDSSRATRRRQARQPRRQQWRRQHRKQKLFRLLQQHGLLPESAGAGSEARKTVLDKLDAALAEKHLSPGDHLAHQRLPYLVRARALRQRLEPFELGRALYHLGQRRGFLSNRKGQDDDEERGRVAHGIGALDEKLRGRTLGEYFATEINPTRERIRQRYTARSMYRNEFQRIREGQAEHHPHLSDPAWKAIENAIFHQRSLKSQRHLIGHCELEPRRRRCPEALPVFQEFRILQAVNNLRVVAPDHHGRELTPDEREKLLARLQRQGEMSFSKVRTLLKLPKGTTFSLEEWEPRLVGHRTNAKMLGIFGDRWFEMSDTERDQITLDVLHYLKPDALKRRAMAAWGLDREPADALARLRLEEGYASHSRRALLKLVDAMRDGTPYATARRSLYPERFQVGEPDPLLKPVLAWNRELGNPAVIRALTELRKVVNALVRKYGTPARIHIELARELKNSRDRRRKLWQDNMDKRKRRVKAIEAMQAELPGHHPTQTDIVKWLLAEECNWVCPYTGKSICAHSLIGPHPQFDIEHIYPRRYLDDSFTNKTLCHVEENRNRKRDRLPWEAYGHDAEEFERILGRVRAFQGPLATQKLKRFEACEVPEDFTTRHLNDTRYNTRLAADYLGTLYGGRVDAEGRKRVFTPTGGLTWMLRRGWQLDGVLSTTNEKTRDDHRHHAIDAIVVALTDQQRVNALEAAAADAARQQTRAFLRAVENPWNGFADEVRQVIEAIYVSHRATRTIAGPLHAESIYSKPIPLRDGTTEYRIRKQLHKLTAREITGDQIVDPRVRAAVQGKFEELGGRRPEQAFADPANHPVLKTNAGREIPIHKVRLRVEGKPRTIAAGPRQRNIMSGKDSNYASMIYAVLDEQGNEIRWEHEIVTRLDAHERLSAPQSPEAERVLVPTEVPGRRFKFALRKNDLLLVEGSDEERQLFRVQKLSTNEIQLCEHWRPTVANDQRTVWNRIQTIDLLRRRNARPARASALGEIDSE